MIVRTTRLKGLIFVSPALFLVSVFFIFPILRLFTLSFGLEGLSKPLGAYSELFANDVFIVSLLRTLKISILVTICAMTIGYPIAYTLSRTRGRFQALLALGVLLPFWTSILVRNYALLQLLRRQGTFNDALISLGLVNEPIAFVFNELGVVIGMTNALLPFMILPIFVALQSQNRALVEAADSLGAAPGAAFLTVTLPLSLGGVYAGCLLVFATALGFFVTPALLGGGKILMTAIFISREIEVYLNWPLAAAASMVLLGFVVIVISIYAWIVSIERLAGMGDSDA